MNLAILTLDNLATIPTADRERIYRALRDRMAEDFGRLAREGRSLSQERRHRAGAYPDAARNAAVARHIDASEAQHEADRAQYDRLVSVKYALAILTGRYDGRLPAHDPAMVPFVAQRNADRAATAAAA